MVARARGSGNAEPCGALAASHGHQPRPRPGRTECFGRYLQLRSRAWCSQPFQALRRQPRSPRFRPELSAMSPPGTSRRCMRVAGAAVNYIARIAGITSIIRIKPAFAG
jgi:hypothetical protein